jgi:hypothetical protein
MPENATDKSSKRSLESFERISEVLFGLIIVLRFTASVSTAAAGRAEIRSMGVIRMLVGVALVTITIARGG